MVDVRIVRVLSLVFIRTYSYVNSIFVRVAEKISLKSLSTKIVYSNVQNKKMPKYEIKGNEEKSSDSGWEAATSAEVGWLHSTDPRP